MNRCLCQENSIKNVSEKGNVDFSFPMIAFFDNIYAAFFLQHKEQ